MEAVAQKEQPTEQTGRTGSIGADFRIHPHLLKPKLKASAGSIDFQTQLRQYASGRQGRSVAQEYALALGAARHAFVTQADTPATSDVDAALDKKAEEYIALLLGLINTVPRSSKLEPSPEGGAPSTTSKDDVEDILEQERQPAAASQAATTHSPAAASTSAAQPDATAVKGDSKLRRGAVAFAWKDVMLGSSPAEVKAHDAIYELASVLESVALWKMARAAVLCSDCRAGISSETVKKAYNLLRTAAGIFEFVRDHCATFMINAVTSTDCNVQTAQAYALACIAEAQSLTVLTAIQKGNEASLVASLSADAAAAFTAAAGTARGMSGGKADSKFALYADYQAAVHQAYALSSAGISSLTSQQAGAAVRRLTDAAELLGAAKTASKAYDRAEPVTPAGNHEYADLELKDAVEKPLARAKRDNSSVYFQHVPTPDSMPAIQPIRLAKSTPYVLPAPAMLVTEALQDAFAEVPAEKAEKLGGAPAASAAKPPGSGEEKAERPPDSGKPSDGQPKGGAWWQWLLVIIAMPLLAIISLVGAVVWVLLLPLKCFCCPVGCAAQLLWNAVEWLLKAPLRALLWASGKPWQPEKPAELKEAGKKGGDGKGGGKGRDRVPPV